MMRGARQLSQGSGVNTAKRVQHFCSVNSRPVNFQEAVDKEVEKKMKIYGSQLKAQILAALKPGPASDAGCGLSSQSLAAMGSSCGFLLAAPSCFML